MAPTYSSDTGADSIVAEFSAEARDKVFLITGVSPNGLGAFFAEAIAKASPKLIILAGRSTEKAQETAASIKKINSAVETRVLHLDLASFTSVRNAAKEVNAYHETINVLVNNAGIMGVPYAKTEDGFESHLQSNHLSHFLFTNLIITKMLSSGHAPRVVNVSSEGYRVGGVRYFDYNFHDGESYDPWFGYGASKTLNILFTSELARRLGNKGLVAVSLSPGVIYTNLSTHGAMEKFGDLWSLYQKLGDPLGWATPNPLDPNHGVAIHAYAALAPAIKDFNGGYIKSLAQLPEPIEEMSPWAVGELEGKKSWEFSEKLVGQKFDFSLPN